MNFRVTLGDWAAVAERVKPVRLQVFVVEQGVPADLEIDGRDASCVHAVAEDDSGRVIGTGRLLPAEAGSARLGRMAVYEAWRSKGVGAVMLEALTRAARERGDREIVLHAQLRAAPFYDRHGYERVGDIYEEAGIAHVTMRRAL